MTRRVLRVDRRIKKLVLRVDRRVLQDGKGVLRVGEEYYELPDR